jgi:hypothetical protein
LASIAASEFGEVFKAAIFAVKSSIDFVKLFNDASES